jgi:hypothetical protein
MHAFNFTGTIYRPSHGLLILNGMRNPRYIVQVSQQIHVLDRGWKKGVCMALTLTSHFFTPKLSIGDISGRALIFLAVTLLRR